MTEETQTDNTSENQNPEEAAPKLQAPPMIINAQYVKDLSFEAPNSPQIFAEMKQPPEITIDVDVLAQKMQGENMYNVDVRMKAEGKVENKTAFLVEITYGAVTTLNVQKEAVEPMLLIETPRHMFPFIREIIADVTTKGGFPPLMITPIDFTILYQKRKMAEQQAAVEATAGLEEKPDPSKLN
jgi:preprotein translocase subunit SecB